MVGELVDEAAFSDNYFEGRWVGVGSGWRGESLCHFCIACMSKVLPNASSPSSLLQIQGHNRGETHCRYFKQRSLIELADSELFRLRMQACERIAKLMIDSVQDDEYLFTQVLLKRSSPLLIAPTSRGYEAHCH